MNHLLVNRCIVSPFATNCYIVHEKNNNSCVIIDPGGDPDVILFQLAELKLQLSAIFITHGHIDHIMALSKINPEERIPVYAHPADKILMENVRNQGELFGLPDISVPAVSNWIEEGEQIAVDGLNFKVIHTPGHSPGGCCFLADNRIFVGDTLFESSIGRTDLPGGDYDQLINSIKNRLFKLPEDLIVYPGHGDQTTIGHEKKYNPFLRGDL